MKILFEDVSICVVFNKIMINVSDNLGKSTSTAVAKDITLLKILAFRWNAAELKRVVLILLLRLPEIARANIGMMVRENY